MLTMDPKHLHYVNSEKHKYQLFMLPYAGNVSMYIFVPHEKDGLAKILQEYSLVEVLKVIAEMKETLVQLNLPRFEYDYQIDLNEILPKMGFNLKTALQGIDARLQVDQALHKAKIRTDNAGTEAAAVTVLSAVPYSAPATPVQIDVTHPFLYAIVELQTYTPLFVGVVNKLNN
ncbi:hypothetical protein B4U80_13223 [Leptotrombidium deliense]|uniref:Serpin domain-containing protein n=1 Tax=Leptotrombidium deliense TaxID=299467 RepID=A0A443SA54_9ACAR|nr:hypothetical protein B4U80_13223 [Leptotrombidium deliense]